MDKETLLKILFPAFMIIFAAGVLQAQVRHLESNLDKHLSRAVHPLAGERLVSIEVEVRHIRKDMTWMRRKIEKILDQRKATLNLE